MGMFDTVWVPCPKCGKVAGFQSKGGACRLDDYHLDDAPSDVLADANRHGGETCEKCGTKFRLRIQVEAVVELVEAEGET